MRVNCLITPIRVTNNYQIIVVGKTVEGMTGNIISFDSIDTFSKKDEYEQLKLFEMDRILRINAGDDIYG